MSAVFGLYMHVQTNCLPYYVIQKFSPCFGLRSDPTNKFSLLHWFQHFLNTSVRITLFVLFCSLFLLFFFFANLNCSSQVIQFTTENYINFRRKETFLKVQQNFRYACLSTKTFSEGKKIELLIVQILKGKTLSNLRSTEQLFLA